MTPYTETASDVLLRLPPNPAAARLARRALAQAQVPDDLEHTVNLLSTEVIANALRHGGVGEDGHIVFAARFVEDFIRVEVHDGGPGFDRDHALQGRGYGLRMVDKLASRWGVDGDSGTRVWFELDRRSRRFRRRSS